MPRFALAEETQRFAAEVAALLTPLRHRRWRERVEALWADAQARGLADRTDATRKLYASRYRQAVRGALAEAEPDAKRRGRIEAQVLGIVRLDPEVSRRLGEDYKARVNEANADLVLVPEWEGIVAALRAMLASPHMEDRALGIMGLTGRRFEEVVRAGDLAPSMDRSPLGAVRHRWLLDFSGQLKTGSGGRRAAAREGEAKDGAGRRSGVFRIPTLAPAAEVLAAFRVMRDSPWGRTWADAPTRQLSTSLNPVLNRRLMASPVASLWPEGARLSLKELRALYAEVAYRSFAPRTTRAPYFARILGHSEDDLTTALSYMRYSLDDRSLREGQEEMNRLTMLREQRRQEAVAAKGGPAEDEAEGDAGAPDAVEADDLVEPSSH